MNSKRSTIEHSVAPAHRGGLEILFGFFREDPKVYGVGIFLSILVGVLEFLGVTSFVPLLASSLGENALRPPVPLPHILTTVPLPTLAALLGLLVLLEAGVSFFREAHFVEAMSQWRTRLSLQYIRAIAYAQWSALGALKPGEVEVTLTRDIALSMKLRHISANFIADSVLSLMYIAIVVYLSWYTVALFFSLALIFWSIHRATAHWRIRYAVLARERYVLIARLVIEYFADSRGLVMSNRGSFLDSLGRHLDDAAHAQKRNDQLNILFKNIHQPILLFLLLLSVGVFLALHEPLSLLAGVFYIFYRAAPRLVNVAAGYGTIVGESPIDVGPEILRWQAVAPTTNGIHRAKDSRLRLNELTVGYGDDSALLKNVTMDVAPGDLVCITGKSGTGKSTLLDVFCGFRAPLSGTLELGSVSHADLDWAEWRGRLGLLRTESAVVSGSWIDNVAFLVAEPDRVQVHAVLERVGLLPTVESFPNGIDGILAARGGNLSAGQRQRLLLARALYRKPELLLLDEPTSNLDQRTEKEINELLLELKGSVTVVAVSHRQELLQHADKVYRVTTDGGVEYES